MRSTRQFLIAITAAAAAALTWSAPLAAQGSCSATLPAGANPTCNVTTTASSTVGNILFLGNTSPAIDLQATDSVAYEKTLRAGGTTTGTGVTTPANLQDASAHDSVTVVANRPYQLQIQAFNANFWFDRDANYAQCRVSGTIASGTPSPNCAATASPAGKPAGDLYWSLDNTTFAQISSVSPGNVVPTTSNGGKFGSKVYFKSAWFYATDIPGTYMISIKYTLTGE